MTPEPRGYLTRLCNYLIDMENAVILDVEATPTRISKEVNATETMIERTEQRFALKPDRIAGDTAYGTGKMLDWLIKREIVPHIPVRDQSEVGAEDKFVRADFVYDEERDLYICPGGKTLKSTGRVHDGKALYYRARKRDCEDCALKARCCPKAPIRRIPRDINQEARDYAQGLMRTEAYEQSAIERKKIETLFGEVKHVLGLTRLRLRGLTGASDEFLLLATVQNLKRLARYAGRPPPRAAIA